jgi:hypothetical protein
LAKRKEIEEEKASAATGLSGEASVAGVKPAATPVKKEKLRSKNKSRLPRRQKKAQQKAAGRR